MTDRPGPPTDLGPLHPATRLWRVVQQLRSFGTLHGGELDAVIEQLESAGHAEAAARLLAYRELHAQEVALIVDEVAEIRADLEA